MEFYYKIKPYGIGWNGFLSINNLVKFNSKESPMKDLLLMFICIIIVYFGLFGVGYLLYGKTLFGTIMLIISFVLCSSKFFFMYIWGKKMGSKT